MKIALVGTAPSSALLAPYDDPSWTIWGCSPGLNGVLKRCEAFFEIHPFDPNDPTFYPGYIEWLKQMTHPLYMVRHYPEFPASVAYPIEEMLALYSRNFFTSSLAYMMALAITKNPEEIGFWGVDMAATEEYYHQKPGCIYFIELARSRGIKVTIPPQSDLDRPIPLYGFGDLDPHRAKLNCRARELNAKLAESDQEVERCKGLFENAMRARTYFQGAVEDNQYHLNTWTGTYELAG